MRFLSLLLSLSLVLPSPVYAEKSSGGALASPQSTAAPLGTSNPIEDYLIECEEFLGGEGEVVFETRFLEGAKDESQMLKLLYDYHLIFSPLSRDAILLTLTKADLKIPEVKEDGNGHISPALLDEVREKISEMYEYYQDSGKLEAFVDLYLTHIQTLAVGRESSSAERVRHLQVKRLIDSAQAGSSKDLFRKVLRKYLQDALLGSAGYMRREFIANWLGNSGRATKLGDIIFFSTITLALAGFNYWLFDTGNWSCPYEDSYDRASRCRDYLGWLWSTVRHLGLSTIVGFAAALASVPPILVTLKRYDHWSLRRSRFPKYLIQPTKIQQDGAEQAHEFHGLNIFKEIKREFNEGILSVKEACEKDICQLSPAQVAYIGHIDVMEVKALQDRIRQQFRHLEIKNQIEKIRKAAEDLLQNPLAYRKQVNLRRSVHALSESLKSVAQQRTDIIELYERRVRELKEDVQRLAQKPYTSASSTTTDRDIAKNEILLVKLQSDLAGLDKIPLNSDAFQRRLERSRDMAKRVEQKIEQMPTTREGWKEVAEDLLIDLDRIEK